MGYGNNGRYGGPPNPYAQAAPSPKYGGYSNVPAMGRDDYGGQNVEMASLTQNGSQFGQQTDPNAILNACRDLDVQIREASQLVQTLADLTTKFKDAADQSAAIKELNETSSAFSFAFGKITNEMGRIKTMPESRSERNAPQIALKQRNIKTLMTEFNGRETAFKHAVRDQMRREYKIVNPYASQEQIEDAVPNAEPQQMFQQALMQSNRMGQANTTLNAVRQRNEAIKKIESDIVEIARMFKEMENMVVQQEEAVVNIEQKGEEVVDNMDKGNQELVTGIASAKARNRKKWWCLGICVAIVAVIVIVILIYKFVIQKPPSSSKRWLLPEQVVRRAVERGVEWNQERNVVPGALYAGGSRKMRQFVA
jgi:syntaxin 1B/2/3